MRRLILIIVCLFSLFCKGQTNNFLNTTNGSQNKENERVALLMVHFGTTYDNTRALTIDAINSKVKQIFKNADVFEAYTSRIVIKRLKERGIIKQTPIEVLLRLKSEGYTRVIVQGTHIINGIEHELLQKEVEQVRPFFDDIRLGNPLLNNLTDSKRIIDILTQRHTANEKKREHVVFVGHGTTSPSTAIYSQIDYMLKANGYTNYHVGTIEGYPTYDTVLKQLKESKAKSVLLIPFMFVAGDHATNDISVDWKNSLEEENIHVLLKIEGLGQIPEIQDIIIEHIRESMKSDPK